MGSNPPSPEGGGQYETLWQMEEAEEEEDNESMTRGGGDEQCWLTMNHPSKLRAKPGGMQAVTCPCYLTPVCKGRWKDNWRKEMGSGL